jgi:membrane protein implicated in regulation of membrane protease activity
MGLWVLWVIVAGLFAVGEMHTNGFYLAPFALGAAFAAVLSGVAGVGGVLSAVGFLGVSLGVVVMLRPVAMRHRRLPPAMRTGTAALVGQHALVIERIANHEGLGTVKIGGEVWTARSYDDEREIEPGEQVEVVEIRGATALVLP